MPQPSLVRVTPETVEKTGFFCKMSGRKTEGYKRKRAWLDARFAEGLEIALLGDGERGMIETMPGAHCWRAIEAEDYLVIHCLWVVGKSKGKGLARLLLDDAEQRAHARGYKGLAAVASTGNWLIGPPVLQKYGFEPVVEEAPYSIHVKRFDDTAADPTFSGSFADKAKAAGDGFTVFVTDQCPYLADATKTFEAQATERGIPFRVERIETAQAVREKMPSPYGTFGVVRDGALFADTYLLPKQIAKLLEG
ncbi:GNAT family N-acetyltransferase [Oricola sp.]|uniref:GNAT family N-acetyltransferase n=1 Tax=Oricola sp. TaxID=1979950 RepID=UPI003BABA9D8